MYTVRQKKEPIFFCMHLFKYPTESGIFFTYIRLKESMSISCNYVYLILACIENYFAALELNVLFYQSSNETDDYRLVFTVSISLLRKILNACQN